MRSLAILLHVLVLLGAALGAVDSIRRDGKYLVRPDGSRFTIKGIQYQPSNNLRAILTPSQFNFTDPLADEAACRRDLPLLQDLGVNTLSVLNVNATLSHDACMKVFEDAGIHVIVQLGLPGNGTIALSYPLWDVTMLQKYSATLKAFSKYDNVLAFGVTTTSKGPNAVGHAKAAARDLKSFIKSEKLPSKLLAYVGQGDYNTARGLASVASCGSDQVSFDLYGHESFAWCGNSTVTGAGWDSIAQNLTAIPIPTYMAGFGCVKSGVVASEERLWEEVDSLFNNATMSTVFSGGVAVEYFPTDAAALNKTDYGVVSFGADGQPVRRADFARLKAAFAGAQNPNGTVPSSPAPLNCSDQAILDVAAADRLLPTPNSDLCDCAAATTWSCEARWDVRSNWGWTQKLLESACGEMSKIGGGCGAISQDSQTGQYGDFSSCPLPQRLNWALSNYFYVSGNEATACGFDGAALLARNPLSLGQAKYFKEQCLLRYPLKPSAFVFNECGVSYAGTPANDTNLCSNPTLVSAATPAAGLGSTRALLSLALCSVLGVALLM